MVALQNFNCLLWASTPPGALFIKVTIIDRYSYSKLQQQIYIQDDRYEYTMQANSTGATDNHRPWDGSMLASGSLACVPQERRSLAPGFSNVVAA